MAAATKQTTKLGKDMHTVDTEFISARVIGIMASSRETVSIETLFSHDDSGEMRKTSKSVLKDKASGIVWNAQSSTSQGGDSGCL